MGNCCVAAATATAHSHTHTDASAVTRKAPAAAPTASPSWSFRWDNRTHTEDEQGIEADPDGLGSGRFARGHHHNNNNSSSGNMASWVAAAAASNKSAEIEAVSDGGSPFRYLHPPRSHKSHSLDRTDSAATAGVSFGSNSSIEVDAPNSSNGSSILTAKSFSHTPSPPFVKADPSPSWSSLPSESSSRKARRSPGYQLSRQISDSRIPVLRSLDENSPDDGRHHFHLPSYSSDISPAESHRGSSDGWSMRLFSELVASCRTRPPSYYYAHDNFSSSSPLAGAFGLNTQQPAFPQAADLNTCGVCYKLVKERPPWIAHKMMNNDAPVVAVLVCGHVYHAECLESVTSEVDRFDPCCPVCTDGWKPPASRLSKKTEFKSKSSKISRIAVADMDLDNKTRGGEHSKGAARKASRMGASSSLKGSTSKPFLRRNFTIGSKASCHIPESDVARKKGFWARRWKD